MVSRALLHDNVTHVHIPPATACRTCRIAEIKAAHLRAMARLCRRQAAEDKRCPTCGILLLRPWTRAAYCSALCRSRAKRRYQPNEGIDHA
jgi:hypothetical protein